MIEFCGLSLEELRLWLKSKEKPLYHANQIFDWIYKKGESNWDNMSNLSKELREELKKELALSSLKLVSTKPSDDGETHKFLWELHDGQLVESVLICSGERRTVCVSSQVGCPAKCAFCASGKEGLLRNLTVGEIVEQVWHTNTFLSTKDERVSHIVFMGMGEPLENYDAVIKTIQILIEPAALKISHRRITVSTVGVVEGIHKLANEDFRVNLVLSLHAPNQKIRQKIIPYARKYSLDEILDAMDRYSEQTGRDITFEYTLLSGINDQPEHAEELALLIGKKQCTINLIPYNPVLGMRLKRPRAEAIKLFREILDREEIVNTCRYTKGDDIGAACGQLAMQKNRLSLPVIYRK